MEQKPHKLREFFDHVKAWIKAHPQKTYLIIGIALVVLAGIVAAVVYAMTRPEVAQVPDIKVEKRVPYYYSPLTGEEVKNEKATTKPVTAIMIENSPDARPQSGLKDAEIVYEAIAEGGITRFLAIYQQNKPKLVGPVRSVRMYYVDWLAPYNASVAHVGGSFKALKEIRKGSKYRDIDQFFNPGTYWRASDRYAPHNVYTSFKKIDALNKKKGYKKSDPKVISRVAAPANDKEKIPEQTKPSINARTVNLNVSSATYNSKYVYNKKKDVYLRFLGGAKHIDREKGQIQAKVVIALKVNMKRVFQDGYREQIATSGKGTAYVFQNGHVSKVTWRKSGRAGQLTFFRKDNTPFLLERGNTWITAVPNSGGSVSWKK